VNTASDIETWRKKYFDSLSSLEIEQRQFKVMEAALKRLAGRLCTAALGQSSQLDDILRKLQNAIRKDASIEELDKHTPALTDAIQALDQPGSSAPPLASVAQLPAKPAAVANTAAPVVAPSLVDERVRGLIANVLGELKRDPDLVKQADDIDVRLTPELKVEQLAEVLAPVSELVGTRIKRIEQAKQEIEVLLSHMVGRLDEIGQFVAEQSRSQNESQASSETLNVQLAGEMKAMGESVDAANDLHQIRALVRNRLDSIDRHLQEFRQRESMLATAMRTRNEHMRTRIAELEGQAKRLQTQLVDQQRLSTIDALTKVPNRLAYEKRIDDEMKRWQRFKQPTCIAVWDVDHFKRVNDTYGHRAGDRVLRSLADCVSSRIRSTDFVARYGGEEFVMILAGTMLDDAIRVVEELRVAISSIGFHFRGAPVSITISAGVTALLPGDTAGAAFDRADKALYKAKESGRNRCLSG